MQSGDIITFLTNDYHVHAIVSYSLLNSNRIFSAFDSSGHRYSIDLDDSDINKSLQIHGNVFSGGGGIPNLPPKTTIVEQLKNCIAEVTFEKVNGESRTMECTLIESYLPDRPDSAIKKQPSETNISVWDINAGGWRSFRYNLLKNIVFRDK
jgi:hypothetical protein